MRYLITFFDWRDSEVDLVCLLGNSWVNAGKISRKINCA